MAGACCLAIECNPDSIDFRLRTRYVDERADTSLEALAMIDRWTRAGEAKSVGLLGNAAEIVPELFRRGIRPDMVTDQTSAHPINGYLRRLDDGRVAREARQRSEGGRKGRARVHARARRGDGRSLNAAC